MLFFVVFILWFIIICCCFLFVYITSYYVANKISFFVDKEGIYFHQEFLQMSIFRLKRSLLYPLLVLPKDNSLRFLLLCMNYIALNLNHGFRIGIKEWTDQVLYY